MQHLKRHSDRAVYHPTPASPLDIARALLGDPKNRAFLDTVMTLLQRVQADTASQQLCLAEPLL